MYLLRLGSSHRGLGHLRTVRRQLGADRASGNIVRVAEVFVACEIREKIMYLPIGRPDRRHSLVVKQGAERCLNLFVWQFTLVVLLNSLDHPTTSLTQQ